MTQQNFPQKKAHHLKQKERGQTELKEYVAQKKEKPAPWFATVVSFLTGTISEEEFLAAAKDETPKTTAERRCEAYFYAEPCAWRRATGTAPSSSSASRSRRRCVRSSSTRAPRSRSSARVSRLLP